MKKYPLLILIFLLFWRCNTAAEDKCSLCKDLVECSCAESFRVQFRSPGGCVQLLTVDTMGNAIAYAGRSLDAYDSPFFTEMEIDQMDTLKVASMKDRVEIQRFLSETNRFVSNSKPADASRIEVLRQSTVKFDFYWRQPERFMDFMQLIHENFDWKIDFSCC